MSTITTPPPLPHHSEPCPDWCDGCSRYSENGWSDYEDHAWRPHAAKVGEYEFVGSTVGYSSSLNVLLSVNSDERYDVDWQSRTISHTMPDPLVAVQLTHRAPNAEKGVDDIRELSFDMTAEQLRQCAEMLTEAAYWLEHLEELPHRRSTQQG